MTKDKMIEGVKNPNKIIKHLGGLGYFKWLPDKIYIKICYKAVYNKTLDLDNPKTFNEKLQWLKLNDRKPIYTTMVDKYEAKEYVASIIGKEHIIPTLGIWERFDDIDFSILPNQFVLKCTHDSGGLVICKNKELFNIESARKKINKSLKRQFFYVGREWPYKDVKPRIIAEKYMEDKTSVMSQNRGLTDYKFYCFNGVPQFLYISNNLADHDNSEMAFYDLEGNEMEFRRPDYNHMDEKPIFPAEFQDMINLATIISKNIPFLRVDMYVINNQIYFSECTFYPNNGLMIFQPDKYDLIVGDMLKLPIK